MRVQGCFYVCGITRQKIPEKSRQNEKKKIDRKTENCYHCKASRSGLVYLKCLFGYLSPASKSLGGVTKCTLLSRLVASSIASARAT